MSGLLMLSLVACSSLLAYRVVRRTGTPASRLPAALARVAEALGLAVVFYAANLAVGVAFVLAARLAGRFVSLYDVADPTLLVLSLAQALVLQAWLGDGRPAA